VIENDGRPEWIRAIDLFRVKEASCIPDSLATVLITEKQVDPKTAQEILRHANSDVTMQIYTHAQDEAKRKALEEFEARLVQ